MKRFFSLSKWRPKEGSAESFRVGIARFATRNSHTQGSSSLLSTCPKDTRQLSGERIQRNGSDEDLFAYRAQRWLWNEQDQLQRRYRKFDVEALIAAAEKAAGSGAKCKAITKLSEGNFNKVMVVEMANEREVVARIPNPNAGLPRYSTASEVATMDYVRNRLQVPVPKVLAYNARADASPVGAEYIIMEKCPGVELRRVWEHMSGKEKLEIVKQVADFLAILSKARFPYYGSLYYSRDIPDIKGTEVDETFSVGPITTRSWFDDGKGGLDIFRGPWKSAQDFLGAVIARENACLQAFPDFPRDRQQGIYNGPGGYHPSKEVKTAVIRDFIRIMPSIFPTDEAYSASVLWHNDLHLENIFVNEKFPTEITGMIDWQGVHLSPAFMHIGFPSFLDHEGPRLDEFKKPELPPNFAELDPEAQKTARTLQTAQSLWLLYKIHMQRKAPDVLRTIKYQETLPCQIMVIMSGIYSDGEAYIQSLLSQLSDPETWKSVVEATGRDMHDAPCPLAYTHEQVSKQQQDLAKWADAIGKKGPSD